MVFFTLAGQPNIEERLKGFKDVLATRPDIKIVDVIDIKSDASVAFDKAQEMLALTGPKKIDAFVCLDSIGRQAGFRRDQARQCHRSRTDCLGCEPRYT